MSRLPWTEEQARTLLDDHPDGPKQRARRGSTVFYRDFDGEPVTFDELRAKAIELSKRGDHAGAYRLLWSVNGVYPHVLLPRE